MKNQSISRGRVFPYLNDISKLPEKLSHDILRYLELWAINRVADEIGSTEIFKMMSDRKIDLAYEYIRENGFSIIWIRLAESSGYKFQLTVLRGKKTIATLYVWPRDVSVVFNVMVKQEGSKFLDGFPAMWPSDN